MSKLPIPPDALSQHVIVLGKTRSGKSSKVRVLVEWLLANKKRVVILTPKDDWWGLKASADGKQEGYPIVIFGGKHEDLPFNPRAGAQVAELIATGNRPCLITFARQKPSDRTRFYNDFMEGLFKFHQGELYVVIDEVHNFAPKGKVFSPDAGMMIHWSNTLASEGQGQGLIMIAASQRPQKVHNDLLTSCETLIACRVIHKADRDANKDWIDGCADPQVGRDLLADLASMDRSDAWCWSPEIGFGPKRISWPMFETFDSFKPQTGAAPAKLKGWADVDLDEVKSKLQAVVKEAEANDPAALRRRIAELELTIKGKTFVTPAPATVDPAAVDRAYKDGYDAGASHAVSQGFDKGYAAATAAIAGIVQGVVKAGDDFMVQLRAAATAISDVPKPAAPAYTGATVTRPRATVARPAPRSFAPVRTPVLTREKQARGNGHDASLSGVQQRILDALAELEQMSARNPERELLAFMSGYSHVNSKGFANAMGSLRSAGYIEGTTLTDLGRQHAEPPAVPRTPAEIQERIVALLGGASARVLQPLIAAYPRGIERRNLAEAAGYGHVNSKGFANAMGRMRSLGFIDYRGGEVVAKPLLFLE